MTAAELKAAVRDSLKDADLDEICENWSLPTKFEGSGLGFENLVHVVTMNLQERLSKRGMTFES